MHGGESKVCVCVCRMYVPVRVCVCRVYVKVRVCLSSVCARLRKKVCFACVCYVSVHVCVYVSKYKEDLYAYV